jgi:hypothetical protein
MDDIETAWSNFCDNDEIIGDNDSLIKRGCTTDEDMIPKCSTLNISTKTKIAYLNSPINLIPVFWKIPLIKYHEPCIGIVKKQMKFNSTTQDEVDIILQKKAPYIDDNHYIDDYIINQIHKPDGRIKFKDIRKISIGICKKDITSYRCKPKSAFYNCFVVILRLLHNDTFKEIHVKVFNTGRMEIPGIQDATILNKVLTILVAILAPIVAECHDGVGELPPRLAFIEHKSETVMINSNFNCGYYINREKIYKLLKYTYKINSNFDPCSYPGVQCEFYYDSLLVDQRGAQPCAGGGKQAPKPSPLIDNESITKVSFMIFRTGSVLIVGKCSEEMLYKIYNFLCAIFEKDYDEIKWVSSEPFATKAKVKTRKLRKKTIYIM